MVILKDKLTVSQLSEIGEDESIQLRIREIVNNFVIR